MLFVGGDDWVLLSGYRRGDQQLTLMFVGGCNRGPLGGALQGITTPSPCCPNPSSLDFWIGIFYNFYNFDITNIFVIVISRGKGDVVLVSILCIYIVPIVIPVPSIRGCFRSSLSGPWQCDWLRNSGRTASLSASQYFITILQWVLVCVACFLPIGHHPCPCAWRVRPPLFRFDPFLLSLELSPLLDLTISRYILEQNLSLSLPLPLMRPLLPLERATASSSSPPPQSPAWIPFRGFFAQSACACLFSLLLLSSTPALSLSPEPWLP